MLSLFNDFRRRTHSWWIARLTKVIEAVEQTSQELIGIIIVFYILYLLNTYLILLFI